jgi:Immunoglobulin I-set domain
MRRNWVNRWRKQVIKSLSKGRTSVPVSARTKAAPLHLEELERRIVPTLLGQQLFPADYPTNNAIANAPVSANSATWINAMAASRGNLIVNWGAYTPGSGGALYSMPYNVVHSNDTVHYTKVKVYIDNYPNESDLTGTDPTQGNRPYVLVPMPKVNPQNLFIEGDNQNGGDPSRFTGGGSDSHLIVWDADTNTAYEMWETSRPGESSAVPSSYYKQPAIANQWNAANEATWNMTADSLRTLGYTSGDAAGLPILNNTARPDEVLTSAHGGQSATPVFNHALRFTLERGLISNQFTYPASHVASGSGGIPYGTRFRLKNDTATNNLILQMGPESQVIAHALQQYGLILADIGMSMFVQGAATSVDANNNPIIDPTTGKPITWDMNDLTPDAVSGQYTVGLDSIPTTDFEAVDLTPRVTGLSASSGSAGSTITITGVNFSGAAGHLSVLFVPPGNNPPYTSNGQVTTLNPGVVAASSVTIVDDQHLQVVVPNGSGTVDVRALSGRLLDDTYNSDAENATAPISGYGLSPMTTNDLFTYSSGSVAPAITTQPMSQTVNVGQTASFSAAASGSPTPTVRWQVSTNSGSTWSNIAGATMGTYSFTTFPSQTGFEYRAIFTNSAGSATSNAATLSFSPTASPSITTQPTNQTVAAGQTASFSAAANGSPAPSVLWQVSTDGGATWNNISGATSTTLTVPASSAQNGNKYRAVFRNNILVNGDFDGATRTDAITGDMLPNGWSLGPPSPATLSKVNVDSAVNSATFLGPESGAHYIRFQSPANNGTRDCLLQDLNTVAGHTYVVSFFVAITSTSAGNTLGLNPVWDENTSNQQTMSNAFYVSPSNTGPVNYQLFQFRETASTNKTRLDFHGIDANGSILLDNVRVVATAVTRPATLTVTGSATAPSITTQPANQTVTGGQDAGIDTQYGIYNGGNGGLYLKQPNLEIGTDGSGSVFESLFRFNNLGIPGNGDVSGAIAGPAQGQSNVTLESNDTSSDSLNDLFFAFPRNGLDS